MKNAARHINKATPLQLALSGVVGLLLSYAFIARALDTASYWLYLGSIVFFGLSVLLVVRSFKKYYGKN